MAMVVKNNMSAINTLNVLGRNSKEFAKQLQQVSSGMKINSAADDASSYAISERMRVQIRSLDATLTNTQNGSSMMKVAEGAVSSTVDALRTFKAKAIDAANDTNTDSDRAIIQKELDQLMNQIDDNALVTFNGKYLVNGAMGGNIVADQQDSIVSFMAYLDACTSGTPQELLDGAIKFGSSGMFKDEASLINSFVEAMRNSNGDLLEVCGINLNNDDTGSITGLDAGGEKAKTAESVVPEEKTSYGGNTKGSSFIRGLTVNWPDDISDDMQKAIAGALDSQWLTNCMWLVDESFAINFWENGTSVKSMDVNFEDDASSNNLAYVTNYYNDGVTTKLELTVNMHYYNNLDLTDKNGAVKDNPNQLYLDRTLAHEMTHAIMAANIKNFNELPKYVKEGMAELVHGIDDYRKGKIQSLANDPDTLKDVLKNSGAPSDDSAYAAGYMVLRYMAKQAASSEPEKSAYFQIGTKASQTISIGLADMRCEALGLTKADGTAVSVATQQKATSAITVIDRAISRALKQQTIIGSIESRLEFTAANITTATENVTSAESVIRDADMAKSFTAYTKANVLMQTAQSMLGQANQNGSAVLSLLQ
ncbi:flagellin [Anaerovibrio lipolyticus DSM 3074]|uniref:Flagellin n=3 Tax=Anaerovibrio lipolyticus TaxID=82374 RepID=A0A1M6C3R3_9FIRM|nr:flagellin [Anaerovibrio lipolyticus DSM 3074]